MATMTRRVKSARWAAKGKTVGIRPFRATDLTARYQGWLNNPELNRYLSRQRWKGAETKNWVALQLRDPNVAFFAVCRIRDSWHVGNVKLDRRQRHRIGCGQNLNDCECPQQYGAEIGILIGEPGHGYGTEAIRLARGWAFRTWQVEEIRAGIITANARSIAAFAKAGFTFAPEKVWATCR